MLLEYLIPIMELSFNFSFAAPFEADKTPSPIRDNYSTLIDSTVHLRPLYSFFVLGMSNFVLLSSVPFVCLIYFG